MNELIIRLVQNDNRELFNVAVLNPYAAGGLFCRYKITLKND